LRYIKLLVWVLVGVLLVIFALGNNQTVQVYLVPDIFSNTLIDRSIFPMPLFIIVYLVLLIGVIFGFVFEYFRQYKYRLNLRIYKKEINSLRVEVQELKSKTANVDLKILNKLD
jgi:putative membrane protein